MSTTNAAAAERLERAKRAAEAEIGGSFERRWLVTTIKAAYGGDQQAASFHVLEGSPPRAYIIENPDMSICLVLDQRGRVLGEARGGINEPVHWVPMGKRR